VYGNGERQVVELAHRLARGEAIEAITDLRGTAFRRSRSELPEGFAVIDSRELDAPGPPTEPANPYAYAAESAGSSCESARAEAPRSAELVPLRRAPGQRHPREKTFIRLPDFESVRRDKVLY